MARSSQALHGGAFLMRLCLICSFAVLLTANSTFSQTSPAATTTQTANPELVGKLVRALGTTPGQAESAAGSLFTLAKNRLQPRDWSQVAAVVPGISGLLKAAPAVEAGTGGDLGSLANAVGLGREASQIGTVAAAAAAFEKLGLSPELVAQAVPIITNYVKQKGGERIAQLLAGALS
jgi:hypothetical protein